MIVTAKREIPWSWVILAALPLAAVFFQGSVMGQAFIFTLKKFFHNPETITFIISLPPLISMVVGTLANLYSDRIWTRIGRRKPFLILAWGKGFIFLPLMPLCPDAVSLLTVYFLSTLIGALSGPYEPLKQEIVPPPQRGRATAFVRFLAESKNLFFYLIMFGRFDDATFMGPLMITGEMVLYVSVALMWLAMFLLLCLGIKESPPSQEGLLTQGRRTLGGMFKALVDPHLRNIYTLLVGLAVIHAGAGVMGTLMYTEQWGYSKQEMGINVAVGATINLFVIGFIGYMADKVDRMKLFFIGMCLSLGFELAYYVYVSFVLPDQRPSLVEMILFGEMIAVTAMIAQTVQSPLIYNYIERNRMGTYQAGATLVNQFMHFVTLNGIGWFVKFYSIFYMPPAGESTQIVFTQPQERTVIEARLQQALAPSPDAAAALDARPWFATGRVSDTGVCFEVRRANPASETVVETERKTLEEGARTAEAFAQGLRRLPEDHPDRAKLPELEKKIVENKAAIAAINARLEAAARDFRQQVLAVFPGQLVEEGDQIRALSMGEALVLSAIIGDISRDDLEAAMRLGHRSSPTFIDLRHAYDDQHRHSISTAILRDPAVDPATQAAEFQTRLTTWLESRVPGRGGLQEVRHEIRPVVQMTLSTVEDPVEYLSSPITRVAEGVLAGLGVEPPSPDRRLAASSKGVRKLSGSALVRLSGGSDDRTVVVTAVDPGAGAPGERSPRQAQLAQRLAALQPSGVNIDQALRLYEAAEKATAVQRLTIVRPDLATGYKKLTYNYFAGYLWLISLAFIGLLIVARFYVLTRRGLVHEYGLEEHQKGAH